MMTIAVNNIQNASIDQDTLSLLLTAFQLYEIAKLDNNVYRKGGDLDIPINLIELYYKLVKPNYNNMLFTFRRKYISNELLVEKNDSSLERKGMNLVYDYIQNFDVDNDKFDIFTTSLILHNLLYQPLDAKNTAEVKQIKEEALRLKEEAKAEKSIEKYRKAQDLLKGLEGHRFGGQLRKENVVMADFDVDIPDYNEAVDKFNEFLKPDKIKEYEDALNNPDIFAYIDYAVNTTADLIGMQPFGDGNKRVFRSLLNLMFKKKNLPPVYITRKERKAYHMALEKALRNHDYSDLDAFYYYKICDSIYELDFQTYLKQTGYVSSRRTMG